MPAPLHQLPNGDWITLEDVREIDAQESEDEHSSWTECRVLVVNGEHIRGYLLPFLDIESARAYRDTLARIVNVARGAEQPAVDRAVPAGEFP